jgi:predicted secreted hydrolase
MRSKRAIFLVLLLIADVGAADYKSALPGYEYHFPKDHFDHPDDQTEWWYYTGNLRSIEGRRFGFELTFFRQAIARDTDGAPWHIRDLYMAHLALTDVSGRKFYHVERLNRAGPGISGVDAQRGLIWNGNWQAELLSDHHHLRAMAENFAIDFNLSSEKPPVIHGRNGVSQKAAGEEHASHYISFTRLLTTGSIELNGTVYRVEGTSWMDHEFFTNSMAPGESGWDWLSLQFEDGTELMLYRLRHSDGSVDPYSSATYIDGKGKSFYLSSKDFAMEPLGEVWKSSRNEAEYPIAWHVSIPSLSIEVDVSTPVKNQELSNRIGPSYWEGAIDVKGRRTEASLQGVGYLEMTGYANK